MKLAKVRVSGDAAAFAAESGAFDLAEVSALYPNRRDPGYRVYLTLLLPDLAETTEDQRGAAHHHQAIRRPAAPITAKESQGRKHLP